MTSIDIQFIHNKKKPNKKGIVAIYMRITIPGKKAIDKSTGVFVKPSDWNPKKQKVKDSDPSSSVFNEKLQNLKSHYLKLAKDIYLRTGKVERDQLINIENSNLLTNNFNEYFRMRIDEKLARNEITKSTYTRTKSTYQKLINFKDPISFHEITQIRFLESFFDYMRDHYNNGENSIKKSKGHIRSIIYDAISQRLINQVDNPFNKRGIKVGVMKSEKFESLTLKQLEQLERYTPINHTHEKVKDIFLFSCYTGLSYSDYAKLSFEDIQVKNGEYYISSSRKKTASKILLSLDRLFMVPEADSKPTQILKKYMGKYEELKSNEKDDRLFFKFSNQKLNEYIKEVCSLANIDCADRVSTHWGRHTFGTLMCNDFRVQITIVKELMSHSKIEQTMKYVRVNSETVNAVLDKTNWIIDNKNREI